MKKYSILALALLLIAPAVLPPALPVQAAIFSDVNDQSINAEAITYLKNNDVVSGYPDGTFKGRNRILRAEFVKILAEVMFSDEEINACQETPFTDVPDGEWFEKYVCITQKNNIIKGYPDGTFGPAKFINFVEASKVIAEAEGLVNAETPEGEQWYTKYVKALEEHEAIPSTVAFFDEPITRGEASEAIYRIEANRTDKVSLTYDEIKNPLPRIDSCSALKEKFDAYRYDRPIYYYGPDLILEDEALEAAPTAAPQDASAGAAENKVSSDSYSQTNVQVQGVDEADIVKNDGKYIYLVKGDTVRIVEAYPADQMNEVANIDFNLDGKTEGFYPQEIYTTNNRLVVIGNQYQAYYPKPVPLADEPVDSKLIAPYYNRNQSKILVFDITDRANPKKIRETAFDGYYQTSRRIGNQVYLILNASPNYWTWDTVKSGEDLLPMFSEGNQAPERIAECSEIHYFPGHEVPQYLITAAVDIRDDSTAEAEVLLGSSNNVYASQKNLYIANTVYDRDSFTDWDWSRDQVKSHIFKLSLGVGIDGPNIEFEGRGEVPGRILNQFSMDEQGNYFRIATTKGDVWNRQNPSSNNVYILDTQMKQVGQLENLAPGEEIKSTRFVGDRLYMVTFVQVDPLFVIDLKTPTAPKILGQLKIPGFSEYLHPYDENHIIGFGQETTVTDKGNVLLDGFKMALFDVTDVTNPQQKFVENIGDRGTYSELLYNHKALLFDKEKNLIAFPIQIQELMKPEELQCGDYTKSTCPSSCIEACISENGQCADVAGSCVAPTYEQYQTTFSGALVYNVDLNNGFTERGRVTHLTDEEILKFGNYWYTYNKTIQRILYIGDYLYTVAQGGIKASDLDTVKEVNYLEWPDEDPKVFPTEPVLEL